MSRWIAIVGVLALSLSLAVVDDEAGVGTWLRLRAEAQEARARVAAVEARAETLRREITGLKSDPLSVERAIREDLELARPGEWVLRFATTSRGDTRSPALRP